MGATRELAQFVVETKADDIPEDVLHDAKRDAINVIGVSIYSAKDPSLKHLLDLFDAEGSNPRAIDLGRRRQDQPPERGARQRLPRPPRGLRRHPLPHRPPPLGADRARRLRHRRGPRPHRAGLRHRRRPRRRGQLPRSAWPSIPGTTTRAGTSPAPSASSAASSAPARCSASTADRMVAAFGIGGTQAAGVREVFGSMTKPMHAGRAAQAGVNAATARRLRLHLHRDDPRRPPGLRRRRCPAKATSRALPRASARAGR